MKRITILDIDRDDLEYLINIKKLAITDVSKFMECSVDFIKTCIKYYDINLPSIRERIKSQYTNGINVN